MTRPPFPFSGSEIAKVKACLGSAVLPRIRRTTPGAAMGTHRHRFLQRVNELGGDAAAREQALAEVTDDAIRDVLAALVLDGLPLDPGAYVAELAIAWDWTTGEARELHRGGARDYSMLRPTEIPATLDSTALVDEDGAFVGDYKPEYGHQPAAREHDQLRFGAMGVSRIWRRLRVIVEISRPRSSDRAWRDRGELDMFDLADIAEELRELAARVIAARRAYDEQGKDPPLHVTDACKRCECAHACPAQGKALARVIAPDQEQLTPELAGRAWHWLQMVEERVKEYKDALRAFAWQVPGGIPLGDGRVYGPTTRNNNVIRARDLWHVIKELHGEDAAWAAAKMEIGVERLENALRPIAAATGAKLAHLKREIQRRGELDGSWKVVPDEEVRVHTPRRKS